MRRALPAVLPVVITALLAIPATSGADPSSFTYSVAAGDVTSTGAILWAHGNGAGSVTATVDNNSNFSSPEDTIATTADAARDNTVHATTSVLLTPNTLYYYRFVGDGAFSDTGTFRTAPSSSYNKTIRFAWSGDADATLSGGSPAFGNYPAYGQMAAENNDFNINLGDTIYSDSEVPGSPLAVTRAEKWAHYRDGLALTGSNLQNLRKSAGLYSQWDDHEFRNDFSAAEFGRPIYDTGKDAFTDYAPVSDADVNAGPSIPDGTQTGTPPADPGNTGGYRTERWGKNLELFILDERSFRSAKASNDSGNPAICDNVNELQSVTVAATGGTFTLTYSGQTTAPIDFNASNTTGAASVRQRLEDLSNIPAGGVAVTGGPGDAGGTTPYLVTFTGGLGDQDVAEMTSDATSLTPGGASATVATITPGDVGSPDLGPTAPQVATRNSFALLVPTLSNPTPAGCLAEINSTSRTFLGDAQKAQFKYDIANSNARFKVIVNETPIQHFYALPYDRWEGYGAERDELLTYTNGLTDAENTIWLTTDTHANLINEVRFKTLEAGGPTMAMPLQGATKMKEVVTGPVATNPFGPELNSTVGNPATDAVVHDLFFRPQPWENPVFPGGGMGMDCAQLNQKSYGEVKADKYDLTVNLKREDGTPVTDGPTVAGTQSPCAAVNLSYHSGENSDCDPGVGQIDDTCTPGPNPATDNAWTDREEEKILGNVDTDPTTAGTDPTDHCSNDNPTSDAYPPDLVGSGGVGTHDGLARVGDILSVVQHFGKKTRAPDYAARWNLSLDDLPTITVADIIREVQQFGHDCI